MDKATLKNLYFTFVYPYLIYCVEVWGNGCDTHLQPIIKIQKSCIRTITFSRYFEQTEPLFKELETLSFKKLVIQRILLMRFKYSLGIVPKPITLLFTRNKEIHHHKTRHSSLLHPIERYICLSPNMTQHNSVSFIFPTITNCWKLTCIYVTRIVFMYLFIISSSYLSFIVIRNLKSYSYNIVLSTYAQDIAKIIYSTNVYISIINPLICGRCTLVSILELGIEARIVLVNTRASPLNTCASNQAESPRLVPISGHGGARCLESHHSFESEIYGARTAIYQTSTSIMRAPLFIQ